MPVAMIVSFLTQLVTLRPPVVIGEPYFIAQYFMDGIGFAYPYPGDTLPTTTAYIPPLYVWLLIAVMKMGGGLVAMQVMNLCFLQLGNFFVYRIAKRFASPAAAFIGFAALCFYIPLWLLASAIEPNMLNHALLSATILLLFIIYREPMRRGVYLLLGLVIGLQILVRPDMLLGVVFLGAWLVWVLRKELDTTRIIKKLAFTTLVVVMIVGPWTLRNYLAFDKFILVSANSGYNLFIGNNVGATGEFAIVPENPEEEKILKAIDKEAMMLSPLARDKFYYDKSLAWMTDNPGEFLVLSAKKLYYHWWRRAESGSALQLAHWVVLYDIITLALLLLGFYGLARLRDRHVRWLFIALFAYSTAVSVLFFVQSRHRGLKVDPYLVTLAVYGVSAVMLRDRRGPRPDVISRERLALSKN